MIKSHINARFPGDHPPLEIYRQELTRVCLAFARSDLADPHFTSELTSGDDSKFWSRVSEALVADRLSAHFTLKATD